MKVIQRRSYRCSNGCVELAVGARQEAGLWVSYLLINGVKRTTDLAFTSEAALSKWANNYLDDIGAKFGNQLLA